MTTLDTSLLTRCTLALDRAFVLLQQAAPDSVEYELYRSACVKEFEIIIEQAGKLLPQFVADTTVLAQALHGKPPS